MLAWTLPRRFATAFASVIVCLVWVVLPARADDEAPAAAETSPVAFRAQVQSIFQNRCQGCHQPAKSSGGLVMTSLEGLVKGGESGLPAIDPGKPEESYLLDQIIPDAAGQALMPPDGKPLSGDEIALITRWIAEGAKDDSPAATVQYDAAHPPVYHHPPVIAALDVAPDGSLLAVAGFHEVLLWNGDGSELVGRLVGISERIQSIQFSPDGKRLAVAGGLPGRLGELQVWLVAERRLLLSVPVTFDTIYGASWSPDGSRIAFGCGDNTVRAIDSVTGQQTLFLRSHDDWALGTVFSSDGSHVISVGRDMAVKLIEVATQRFVDNITSITPGALKGGVQAIDRHPTRDEIVIGGSDGVPKIYRVFRLVQRVIGDDSNIIRELPAMPGRVTSIAVSPDGTRIAAGSSHDGVGQVSVYAYEFDTSLPEDIKAIMAKVSTSRSAEENEKLSAYTHEGVREVSKLAIDSGGIYVVAFRPDGTLVAAGADGQVRLINPESGSILGQFTAAPIDQEPAPSIAATLATPLQRAAAIEPESLPEGRSVQALTVNPSLVELTGRFDYCQLIVSARLENGESIDVTRMAEVRCTTPLAALSPTGLVTPLGDGAAVLQISLGGQQTEVPITVRGLGDAGTVDFIPDVNPVLSRLGCNQGTCHGSAQGKNGFKLSLRGYDPLFDVRALTDDHASRRVNVASADASLMLLKPAGIVPHEGGTLISIGDPYYTVIRDWIAAGARLDRGTPKVVSLSVEPRDPVIQREGTRQQLRVLATDASGATRDVTREAFLESGNTEVAASLGAGGLVQSLRRGEAPILARYEGAYASTTLTVMGDRTGFVWEEPPAYGPIDELAARKWERLQIQPSPLCTDAEFLRRVTLDLTGLPPTADKVRTFLADQRESRVKREALVDELIGSPEFIEHWTNKWADLLQVNRKYLDVEGATAFRAWIRQQVADNVPHDQFVGAILTASGSTRENPAASYFKILREPTAIMENTTQLFMAVRFNCNKCHDHPFERWTQDQYYELAAYFAQVGLETDPESKGRMVGGTAVEGAKPIYEIVRDTGSGTVVHDRTREVATPKFPFEHAFDAPADAPPRTQLANWITAPENRYFALSQANRIWGYLLGTGLIEPLDDLRAGNPPSNPELLAYLTQRFQDSGLDTRQLIREICTSRVYQLSIETNRWNEDDKTNYAHAQARRLPAEVLLDAVHAVTGSTSHFPDVPPGTRAAALPDSGVALPDGFLNTFGRPSRESACECERSNDLQLGPVMALVSGPTLAQAIADPENELTRLVDRQSEDDGLVNELFLRILNRPATDSELVACKNAFGAVQDDHLRLVEALVERERDFALQRPQMERQRLAASTAAQAQLTAYEAELAPRAAELEAARTQAIADREAELAAYQAGPLQEKVAAWAAAQTTAVQWAVLTPTQLAAGKGAEIKAQDDGSIIVTGNDENGALTITAETDLTGITAVRLEAIADDTLPHRGPGRAPDGNLVLNEFEVSAAPRAEPAKDARVTLENPLADFSQEGFEIAKAIDGDAQRGSGWALSPATGVTHWATFEAKEPFGHAGGTVLTFRLRHNYGKGYQPGRFRLSITRLEKPVGVSLAEEYRAILATDPAIRSDTQGDVLSAYHRAIDPDYRAKQQAVTLAKQPVPPDARLIELKAALELAKQEVPIDPTLIQLRKDVDQSVAQGARLRLTVAQDLAWALINSSAFLFNH